LAYAILKISHLGIAVGDQGLYYYSSALFAKGYIPYKDFFCAHPPVQLIVEAIVIKIFGTNLKILDSIPGIISALSGFFVYAIGKKALGFWGGLLACVLFLFSATGLYESSHFTGMNLAVLFLLFGIFLFLENRYLLSGLILGVGTHAGVYAGPGFLMILILCCWRGKIPIKNMFLGFILSFGVLSLIFLSLAGKAFLEQIFLYHMLKPEMAKFFESKVVVFFNNISWQPVLFVLSMIGVILFIQLFQKWRTHDDETPLEKVWILLTSTVLLIGYSVCLLIFQRVFYHYVLLLIPFASILSAFLLKKISKLGHTGFAVIATLLLIHITVSVYTSNIRREEMQFESAHTVASVIREEVAPDESIFGNYAIAPTLAFLSGRRIAGMEVDTSAMRFESGISNLDDVIQNIESDNIAAIISQSVGGIGNYPPFREYMEKNFIKARTFKQRASDEETLVEVWLKK